MPAYFTQEEDEIEEQQFADMGKGGVVVVSDDEDEVNFSKQEFNTNGDIAKLEGLNSDSSAKTCEPQSEPLIKNT